MTDHHWFDDVTEDSADKNSMPAVPPADFSQCIDWPVPFNCAAYAPIFQRDEIEGYAQRYRYEVKDRDERNLISSMIRHLRKTGAYRALTLPAPQWRDRLDQLERDFPNFAEYLDYLRTVYAIAEWEGTALQIDPVVFCGLPGIGKTHFANQVALLLGTPAHTVHFETAQSAAEVGGSSSFWSNAKAGVVLTALAFGAHAGPLVILDEVDKTSVDRYDPHGPLYSLLDRQTARSFRDLAHPWATMDTSYIVYIATCNTMDSIPLPLRSRFKVIEVAAPTPAQSRHIVCQIWKSLCVEMPKSTAGIQLTRSALEAVSILPPRLIRKALREAVGFARYHGCTELTERNFNFPTLAGDKQPIGFL